jgi:hypothetical protein
MSTMGKFVDSLLTECARAQGKTRWIDKTPNYYKLIPFIDEIFSRRVLYVGIIRHPLDCIASLEEFMSPFLCHDDQDVAANVRLYGADKYGWAKLWCHIYERIYVAAQSRAARFHMVTYEDLVSDAEGTVRIILDFIGEHYSEGMIERAFQMPHQIGLGDSKIQNTHRVHQQSVNRWQEWSQAETKALWELVASAATRYGYTDAPSTTMPMAN